jgi:predicted nucleic acid-binding protein
MRYFDTGVLLKLYLREPNSPEAVTLVLATSEPPSLSALHRLEMKAAIELKNGRGEITHTEKAVLLADIARDLTAGVFKEVAASWADVFAKAESLATMHGALTLCRSLDTLHIALALEMGVTEFCTFDVRQAAMAKACGLTVVP